MTLPCLAPLQTLKGTSEYYYRLERQEGGRDLMDGGLNGDRVRLHTGISCVSGLVTALSGNTCNAR